ncbi:MAG: glycosyltransferase, partial [Chloroflexota bacterium]|nr:glycosyltransferase [Chloroflexota bacterium]
MTSDHPDDSRVRVTAIVQSFNHEAYVARALESAVSQRGVGTYEVLVGDDASTDGTRDVIEAYARRYPDLIRTVLPPRNMGGAGKVLFSELIRLSRGDYIAVLDADDYWTSDEKCRIQADYLDRNPQCSMVFHNVMRQHEGDRRQDRLFNPPRQPTRITRSHLYRYNPVAACSPMFRREVISPLPEWYFDSPWGDWPLYFLASEAGEIHYLPDVLGAYWIHDAGVYSGLGRIGQVSEEVAFFKVLPTGEAEQHVRRQRLAQALGSQAYEHLRLGQWT